MIASLFSSCVFRCFLFVFRVIVCLYHFSISRKNCYIVSAGDLQNRYSSHEDSGKRMAPGLLIGCHVDTSTGLLSFTVNGQEAANKFQVVTPIHVYIDVHLCHKKQ